MTSLDGEEPELGFGGPTPVPREPLDPQIGTSQLRIVYAARAVMSAARSIAGIGAPIYLAKVGFGGTALGVVFALAGAVALVVSFGVGVMADRWGRRIFLIYYPMLVAVAGMIFAFSRSYWLLAAMAVLASFGRGAGAGAGAVGPYQPAETAIVADLAARGQRNKAFINITQMSVVGAIGGAIVSFLAFPSAAGGNGDKYTQAFAAAALLALAAGVLAFWLDKDRPAGPPQRRKVEVFPRSSLGLLARLWVTNTLNGLGVGMFGPFITYFLYLKFHTQPAEIALLFLVVNVVSLGPISQVGKLAERYGTVPVTVFFRIFQALLLIPFAYAPSFLVAGGVFLVRMVAQRSAMPLRQSYVQGRVSEGERARVAALANIPSQGATAASPALAGYLFDVAPLEVPFVLGGAFQLASTLFYWGFFSKIPPADEVSRRAVD